MVKGAIAFLVSTFVIVVFGEIVPQSACSRHALGMNHSRYPINCRDRPHLVVVEHPGRVVD
jgi:CBS domain containing-hemolysin-like protein